MKLPLFATSDANIRTVNQFWWFSYRCIRQGRCVGFGISLYLYYFIKNQVILKFYCFAKCLTKMGSFKETEEYH